MAAQIAVAIVDPPEREYRFHPSRRWKFDFAWPQYKLAVEVEGGIWTLGRHTRPAGFEADCEKYNHATVAGWRVLRVTRKLINSGEAIAMIRACLYVAPKRDIVLPPMNSAGKYDLRFVCHTCHAKFMTARQLDEHNNVYHSEEDDGDDDNI